MIYGIAPQWRGRGLASRAVRLAARWALSLPGVTTVELRVGQDHTASQHVAVNAGFAMAGTITQFVPGTGKTFEDLRYILQERFHAPVILKRQEQVLQGLNVQGPALAGLSGGGIKPGNFRFNT
jgi:hypothetical protein